MDLRIRIAGITVVLKNAYFPHMLQSAEQLLLGPFLTKVARATASQGKPFVANLINAQYTDLRAFPRIEPRVVKAIKGLFPQSSQHLSEVAFKRIEEDLLRAYLCVSVSRWEKLNRALRGNGINNAVIISPHAFIILDQRTRCADIVYSLSSPQLSEYCTWPPNIYFLKLLFHALIGINGDGAMLHASCVEEQGCGYVFLGRGGFGKTTITRLLQPQRILSDDMTILRRAGQGYKLFPNPWWNLDGDIKIVSPHKPVFLKAMFFIRHARKTSLRRLGYKEALARLVYEDRPFQQAGFFDNKTGIKNFYLFSDQLIKTTPTFELKVRKGPGFKKEFQSALRAHLK